MPMIDAVSELFEPYAEVARVGFDHHVADDMWEVDLYLGTTEIVGGSDDGLSHVLDFQFDLRQLVALFARIDRFEWHALPHRTSAEDTTEVSQVVLEACWQEHPVRLILHSVPPKAAGPGLRQRPDGQLEPI